MFKKILVALDGSERALKALDLASDLAEKYNAELFLLHVAERAEYDDLVRQYVADEHIQETPEYIYQEMVVGSFLEDGKARARNKGVKIIHSRAEVGDPAKAIVNYARTEGVEAIFMGTRGLGDIKGLFLGSVARKVTHMADCSVVTVK